MINITLKQLRYFDAVTRTGHFGRAAETCAISQPAMSMQIKELEETLGVPLLDRSARRVRLTTFGEEFSVRVREVLRSAEELGEMAQAARDGLMGRLRLGIIPTIAPYLLPTLIGDLTGLHAGLDLHVRESLTQHLLAELSDGRIDAAIVALPVSEPAFTEIALFSENFLLVRPSDARDEPIPSPASLREMRLLLLEEGHCFREQALSFCHIRSSLPRETLDGSSLSTLVQMVGSGIGVTLIPEMAADVETRSASVSLARFAEPQPSRTVGMIWRRSSPLAPRLEQVAEVVRRSAATLREKHRQASLIA